MADGKKNAKNKGFFARLFEALDKKMEEKARCGGGCCCGPKPKDSRDNTCS